MMWAWALIAGAWAADDCARALKGKPGQRQVALLVGVGDYAADGLDLTAPAADAARIRDLLVDDYGFPSPNVCVLVDAAATTAAVRTAFTSHLGTVVSGDTVVLYFAGRGARSTVDDAPTYLLHDSRTGGQSDLHQRDLHGLVADVYRRTNDLTVWVDASHEGGPHTEAGNGGAMAERWAEPAEVRPVATEAPEDLPDMVMLRAAQTGMPALERDGQGVFTTALLQALRHRSIGSWHQITHDVARWMAAMNSWQQPSSEGAVDRAATLMRGADALEPWTVARLRGNEVRLQGPPMLGWSRGAVVAVVDGDAVKAQIRLDGVSAGAAMGTVIGGSAKRVETGDPVRLEVPGEDLTAIGVSISPDVRLRSQIKQALYADPVLSQTVHVVERAADFALRPGPGGTIDIVGADGVRRNRLPGATAEDALALAHTMGLYARQASLLALSAEVPAAYPDDMFDVRIMPIASDKPDCARTPYVPTERALPFAQVPMCNAVRLEVTLREAPKQPLHLGVLYLSGNGTIFSWPRNGRRVILEEPGDTYDQVLGWVTPPLHTPDRVLVIGTHEPVRWSQLEEKVLADVVTASRGETGPDFFVSAVAGAKTRSAWASSADALPAWTASMVTVEIVADPELWSEQERDTTSTCTRLRKQRCAAPAAE